MEREFPAKQINLLKTYLVPLHILMCVVYDGTPFMTGIRRGLGGEIDPTVQKSSLYKPNKQELFCGKIIRLENVLESVVSIVNFIRV
jgi:hypothetical protein